MSLRATIPGNGVPVLLSRGAIRNQPVERAAAPAAGRRFFGRVPRAWKAAQPEETRMREVCNLGYGRARLRAVPGSASAADAIRFHVAEDEGGLIKIQYVFERDCWPGEHGKSISRTAPVDAPSARRKLFLESYIEKAERTVSPVHSD